jgi:hypothetical protein
MDSAGGSCFPSIETLVNDTSMSRPTVVKYLKKARNDGWIIVKKHGFSGKQWARNEYTSSLPETVKKAVNSLNYETKSQDKAVNPVNYEGEKAVKSFNRDGDKAVNSLNQGGKTERGRRLTELSTISPYNSTKNSPRRARAREREKNFKNPESDTSSAGSRRPPEEINGCPIPGPLQVDGFKNAFEDYEKHVQAMFQKSLSVQMIQAKFSDLLRLKNEGNPPLEVIHQTISDGNKKFYALNNLSKDDGEEFQTEGIAGAASYANQIN